MTYPSDIERKREYFGQKKLSPTIQVGDIVRLKAGSTPMMIIGQCSAGRLNAVYCRVEGNALYEATNKVRYPSAFVKVTNPNKELIDDWQARMSTSAFQQVMRQQAEAQGDVLPKQISFSGQLQNNYKTSTKITTEKRKSTMKNSTELLNIAAYTSEELTTCDVRLYGSSTDYTFLIEKTLAAELSDFGTANAGNRVAVTTANGYGIGTVLRIHDDIQIDDLDDSQLRFVFQKINIDHLHALEAWQKKVADSLSQAQRKNTRQSALAALGFDSDTMLALPKIGEAPVTEGVSSESVEVVEGDPTTTSEH